jgi:hypothetical protein
MLRVLQVRGSRCAFLGTTAPEIGSSFQPSASVAGEMSESRRPAATRCGPCSHRRSPRPTCVRRSSRGSGGVRPEGCRSPARDRSVSGSVPAALAATTAGPSCPTGAEPLTHLDRIEPHARPDVDAPRDRAAGDEFFKPTPALAGVLAQVRVRPHRRQLVRRHGAVPQPCSVQSTCTGAAVEERWAARHDDSCQLRHSRSCHTLPSPRGTRRGIAF